MTILQEIMKIRLATRFDIHALSDLIASSVRTLQAQDYSPDQIEGALGTVFGIDSQLIADGTYFVVEAAIVDGDHSAIVGCGGWSKRKTLFGSDHATDREASVLDPARDNVRIRAFFVASRLGSPRNHDPKCANTRRWRRGFRGFELGATITGERSTA
jgi:hypothetical protein